MVTSNNLTYNHYSRAHIHSLSWAIVFSHFFQKRVRLLVAACFLPMLLGAQNIDSLLELGQYYPALQPTLASVERTRTLGRQAHGKALVQLLKIQYNLIQLKDALVTADEALQVLGDKQDSLYFDALQNKGGVLRLLTRFGEAEETWKICLKEQEKLWPQGAPDIGETWHWLGNLYSELARYPEALAALEKAEQMYSLDRFKLAAAIDRASVLEKTSKYQDAEALIKEWIVRCELAPRIYGISYPRAYDKLSSIYNDMGDAYQRLAMSKKAVQLCEDLGMTHYFHYGDLLLNLGGSLFWVNTDISAADSIYDLTAESYKHSLGENHINLQWVRLSRTYHWEYSAYNKSALDTIWDIVNNVKAIYGDQHPSYGLALGSVGHIYGGIDLDKKALGIKQQVLSIQEHAYGDQHPAYANQLYWVGQALFYLGEVRQADSCYQKSLRIQEQRLGKNHPDLANVLASLSEIREDQGRFPEADSLRQLARSIEQRTPQKTDYSLATLKEAYRLADSGLTAKADSLISSKLVELEGKYGKPSPLYTGFLRTLATMRKIQSKYEAADSVYMDYLKIVASFADTNSLHYISAKTHVDSHNGKVMGKPGSVWFESLIQQIEAVVGTENGIYASALKDAADYYASTDQFEKAVSMYRQSLTIMEQIKGKKSTSSLFAKHNLSNWLEYLGDYKEAEELLLETISAYDEMGTPPGPNTWNNLGTIKDSQGSFKESEQYYLKAIEYYDVVIKNPYHPNLVTNLVNLAYFKKGFSEFDVAETLIKRAMDIQKRYSEDVSSQIEILRFNETLQADLGNFLLSDSLANEAINLSNKHYGIGHSATATSYNNAAVAKLRLGEFKEADSLQQISLAIEYKTMAKETQSLATGIENWGNLKRNMGDFEGAKILLDSALAIKKRLFPNGHPDLSSSYNGYTNYYYALGDYQKVVEYGEKGLKVNEKFFGKNSYPTTLDLVQISEGLVEMGRYTEADSLQRIVMDIYEKTTGNVNQYYSSILGSRAYLFKVIGKYDEAISTNEQILGIYDKVFKRQNHEHGGTIAALADVYFLKGDFQKADSLRMVAHRLYVSFFGNKHLSTAINLGHLSKVWMAQGKYAQADSLQRVVLGTYKAIYGDSHPNIAEVFSSQAELFRLTGRYDEALSLARSAKEMRSRTNGETEIKNIFLDLQLAKIHADLGEYNQADSLMEAGIKKLIEINPEHPRIAEFQLEQAAMYMHLSLYERADSTLSTCLILLRKHFKEGHPLIAKALAQRADVYLEQGNPGNAVKFLSDALKIEGQLYLPNHPDYLEHQLLLARCYRKLKEVEKAKAIYAEVEKQLSSNKAYYFTPYTRLLSEMTDMKLEEGANDEALKLVREQKLLIAGAYSESHPRMAELYFEEAWASAQIARWNPVARTAAKWQRGADSLLQKAIAQYRPYLRQQLIFLSETEKMDFLAGREYYFNLTNSLCAQNNSPTAVQAAFDQALFRKSAALVAAQDFRRLIKQKGDPALIKEFEGMIADRKEISKLEEKPEENKDRIQQLTKAANSVEASLQRRLPAYADALKAFETDWRQIQQALQPGELLIEYIRYTPPGTDTTWYGALGLRKEWESPRFMPLCLEKTLERKLREHIDHDASVYVNELYDSDGSAEYRSKGGSAAPKDTTVALYKVLWEKLEPWLDGVQTIYYVPERLLHRINPAAIEQMPDSRLIQRFSYKRLTSSRQLLKRVETLRPWTKDDFALLYGGIHYQKKNPTEKEGVVFPYLTFTLSESNQIKPFFEKRNYRVEVRMDTSATESFLKGLTVVPPRPRVIHLPSHGSFVDATGSLTRMGGLRSTGKAGKRTSSRLKPLRSKKTELATAATLFAKRQPLARSFIALAYANDYWQSGVIYDKGEDGLLTAYEIAQMDLSGVDLVVLSACETGLGDLQDGEGVLGLARALKIAGVGQVLVSLWLVPDEQTKSLMVNFYENWLGDGQSRDAQLMSPYSALLKTQRDMIKYGAGKPFNWGSFILVE